MTRSLLAFILLLLVSLGLRAPEARASHAQGGDLRYESLGNNQYRVSLRYFRDCSGINAETSMQLNCRIGTPTSSCSLTDPRNFTAVLMPVGTSVFGTQYCSTVTGICTNNGPANYEEKTYVGTVTLPSAEWTLSVEVSARPLIANIVGQNSIRFEAYLDNRNGLLNNSPNFGSAPVAYVGWKQNISLSLGAFDIDGDSLAYSLVAPLEGCNVRSAYQPYTGPGTGGPVVLSTNPGCILNMPSGLPTQYSPTFPIALRLDTTGTCPTKQGVATAFTFNAANGNMTFSPGKYDAVAPSSDGKNKYAVVVKVEEFRRINGLYRLIGTAHRDMFITVVDCGTNQNPRFANTVRVYGQSAPTALTRIIPVQSGSATSLILTATDANANQAMTFTANSQNVPGVYTQQTAPGTMIMEFTPPASLPDGIYYVTVKVEDNNCPVKGFEMQTIGFRIYGRVLSTRGQAAKTVSTAFPNPFTDQVTFTLARPSSTGTHTVEIVNQLGQVVDRLTAPAGTAADASLTWRPSAAVPAGVYLARFANGQQTVRLLHMER